MRLDSVAEQKRGERDTWTAHIRDAAAKVSALKPASSRAGIIRQVCDPATKQWKRVVV